MDTEREALKKKLLEVTSEKVVAIRDRQHCIPIYNAQGGGNADVYEYANFQYLSNLKDDGIISFKEDGIKYFAIDLDKVSIPLMKELAEGLDDLVIDDSYLDFAEEDFIERAIRKAGFKLLEVDRWLMEGTNGEDLYYDVMKDGATLIGAYISDELATRIRRELDEMDSVEIPL